MAELQPRPGSPILAPPGTSPARASDPEQILDDRRFHIYDSNPVPWWLTLIWIAFLIFGATYLIVNLLE